MAYKLAFHAYSAILDIFFHVYSVVVYFRGSLFFFVTLTFCSFIFE